MRKTKVRTRRPKMTEGMRMEVLLESSLLEAPAARVRVLVGADVADAVVITATTVTVPTVCRRADVLDATATLTACRVELAFADLISVATITDPEDTLFIVMSVVFNFRSSARAAMKAVRLNVLTLPLTVKVAATIGWERGNNGATVEVAVGAAVGADVEVGVAVTFGASVTFGNNVAFGTAVAFGVAVAGGGVPGAGVPGAGVAGAPGAGVAGAPGAGVPVGAVGFGAVHVTFRLL